MQQMIADHGKASEELKSLATTKHITLPTVMDAKHKAKHAQLAKLTGSAFDRAYAAEMVKGHEAAVAAFKHESENGKDPEIKSWAAKTLSTIESHLQTARNLTKQTTE